MMSAWEVGLKLSRRSSRRSPVNYQHPVNLMITPPSATCGKRIDMNDRLAELRGAGGGGGGDVEMAMPPAGGSAFMQAFFDEVQEIKKIMSSIRYNIRQIEQNHGECLTAISAEQSRESSARLEDLMKETNGAASQVRNKLKTLDLENKDFARRNEGASEARIRSNMHGTLTRKFVDIMAEYQEIQTKYKNKYRERGERQYRVVNPTATREEIDAALAGLAARAGKAAV